ncbi:MAG: SDR family oxidoreductase [Candidatus Krumholzibacteria bacterium]|jgi:nucleoside-diphosphate-sugar epimerase|nr:SDR family oxidoreductase [Candidatus Krumholzibacteria bacterium]
MAKVLITGGAGFIGSHLAEALLEDGNSVEIFDNLSTGHLSNLEAFRDRITFTEADLRDASAVSSSVAGKDYVFHEAALASVPRSVKDPLASNDVNVNGTLNLLIAARDAGVRRVIYAASSSAYGNTEVSPKHEALPSNPLSPYAVTKLVGEQYCRAFYEVYGLETLSIRYFNVFGPRQDPDSPYSAVIPIFASHVLDGKSPTIHGDGEQTRDFTYVKNVVAGNMRAMAAENVRGETVNVACGGSYSVNYLFRSICDYYGSSMKAKYSDSRPGDVRDSCADISKARELLSYEPVASFEEGLKATLDWYRSLGS